MTNADLVIRALQDAGVRRLFGMPVRRRIPRLASYKLHGSANT